MLLHVLPELFLLVLGRFLLGRPVCGFVLLLLGDGYQGFGCDQGVARLLGLMKRYRALVTVLDTNRARASIPRLVYN